MKTLIALSALAVLAASCTQSIGTAGVPSFGASLEAMREAQTATGVTSTEAPEGSGAQGAGAQTRYKTGRTHPLRPATTSSVNSSN